MSNYNETLLKSIEKLSYHVTDSKRYEKPREWQKLDYYLNNKTGFYAECYANNSGQKVLMFAGTQALAGIKEARKDFGSDIDLALNHLPEQAEDAYRAYQKFNTKYGKEKVIISGYSLGGSLAQIIGNETGAETVTFAAYGVGDIVKPNHTENIINFGNEEDPVFQKNLDNQLGTIYVVPNTDKYDTDKTYSAEISGKIGNIGKHFPGEMGDLSKAFKYTGRLFKLHASYDNYDDRLFESSNKVQYDDGRNINDLSEQEIKQKVEQYFDNGDRLPKKEEMDRL